VHDDVEIRACIELLAAGGRNFIELLIQAPVGWRDQIVCQRRSDYRLIPAV
jgi:hypothetical protein